MESGLVFAVIIAAWFVINRWVLPRLGIST